MKKLLALLLVLAFTFSNLSAAVPYELSFVGVSSPDILGALNGFSDLARLKSQAPESVEALRYRAVSDLPHIRLVMQTYGYYDAEIRITLDDKVSPVLVKVIITPKEAYVLDDYIVQPAPPLENFTPALLGVQLGQPIYHGSIAAAKGRLITLLENGGYPFAKILDEYMSINQEKHTAKTYLNLDPGPTCTFGPLTITGGHKVKKRLLLQRIKWHEGDVFNKSLVTQTSISLDKTALFSAVNVSYDAEPLPDGSLPMHVEILDKAQRQIGLGLSYSQSEELGLDANWAHYNLTGYGDRLSLTTSLSMNKQYGGLTYLWPQLKREGRFVRLHLFADHEETTNYNKYEYATSVILEWLADKHFRYSLGLELAYTRIPTSPTQEYTLTSSIPVDFEYSTVQLFNPSSGSKVRYHFEPFQNLKAPNSFFVKHLLSFSHYMPLGTRLTLCGLASAGIIHGSPLLEVTPETQGFHAGGPDSIRGYAYESIRAAGATGPIGGRSQWLYTAEARCRIGKITAESITPFSIAAFLDAGNVYASIFPPFYGKLYKSVGAGLRFESPVGPFRLDLAFPLEKRHEDSSFQISVNIGQKF